MLRENDPYAVSNIDTGNQQPPPIFYRENVWVAEFETEAKKMISKVLSTDRPRDMKGTA